MKYLWFIFLFVPCYLFAQPNGRMNGRMPSIGKLYGKVIDHQTRSGVEYATITLLAFQKDSVITGALTKSNGDFMMEKIPMGRYRLRIQFIGFKPLIKNVSVTPAAVEQDLGNISLETDSKKMSEVTIEAEKPTVVMTIDRRIYNVDKDLVTRGGTGLDAMKNLPGITVDADGNVSLRNAQPTIFVDGRPTAFTLEQIPADQIERIEVMTNPSAKYDASTTGGILNIVLKKNTKPGYNGSIGSGIGTNNRYNAQANLNIKEYPFNFFISYNLNTRGNLNNGYTHRTNYTNKEVLNYFNQDNINNVFNISHFGRLGFDYNLSNRTLLTIAGNFNAMQFEMDDNQNFSFNDKLQNPVYYGKRNNTQNNGNKTFGGQMVMRHTFPRAGKEWTADFTYNSSEQSNISTFTTNTYLSNGLLKPYNPEVQKNNGSGATDNVTFQFDYINPYTDSNKIEFGVRSNYRYNTSKLDVTLNDTNGNFVFNPYLSNNYRIDDIVNAIYINYASYWYAGITYQLGVRFEQTDFVARLPDKSLQFEYTYPKGSNNLVKAFFPSLYLSRRIGSSHEFQLNFSRKINRPNFMQVMPFIMFSDRQSYRIGNPALSPEFINTAEANYNFIFGKGNVLTSAFYKLQQSPITTYVYTLPSDSSVLVSTFVNGNNGYNYGLENTFKYLFFKKKLEMTINTNITYAIINATLGSTGGNTTLQNSGSFWSTKMILQYKLPAQFSIQANGSYESPKIIPQGKTVEVYSIDLSLSKDIGKSLSFSLTVNDIFNTKRWGAIYTTDLFYQDFSRRWETRFVRVNFTWRFGEMDVSLFRRKNRNRGEGGSMDMEY